MISERHSKADRMGEWGNRISVDEVIKLVPLQGKNQATRYSIIVQYCEVLLNAISDFLVTFRDFIFITSVVSSIMYDLLNFHPELIYMYMFHFHLVSFLRF